MKFRRTAAKILLATLLLLASLVSLAWFFPQEVLTVDSGEVQAEVLVTLGGGDERIVRTAELFKAGAAPRVICSGSGDCDARRQMLVRAGVPAAVVATEDQSRNTRENAQCTIALLRAQHVQSAIIVTSWYHSRRALRCFEHYAPDIKFYSRPSYFGYARPDWKLKDTRHYARAEYWKLLGYWARYGVCPV